MGDTACNFALSSIFNAKYDITWSLQYSLCGDQSASGGFATFLYNDNTEIPSGGGIRSGLGFAPYGSTYSGIDSAVIGAGFDSTGVFATRSNGLNTGVVDAVSNSCTVRVGSSFLSKGTYVAPFDVIQSQVNFTTLRFNLTDLGQTFNIDYKLNLNNQYTRLASVNTGLLFLEDSWHKIGISYASPVTGDKLAVFKIRNIHMHGVRL